MLYRLTDIKDFKTCKSNIEIIWKLWLQLQLPSVLWRGRQEEHLACKNWMVRYWRGYLSGARCKWFAYV